MVTKTDVANSFLQNMRWSSHHAFLIVMHQFGMSIKLQVHLPPRHQSSLILWEPTPTSNARGGDFRTYIFFFGSIGVSIIRNSNIFICKIYRIYSIKIKSCKMAFMATMCTCVHYSMHMSVMCMSIVYMRCMSWGMCMNMWNLFLVKHRF